MAPKIIICGDIVWAHDEVKSMLGPLAEVVRMDSPSRADFLADFKSGGKYEGAVGVYRHNSSADRIGVFDKEIIGAIAPSVKWIAHNGAGYDQIDVAECKAKGINVSNTPGAVDEPTALTALYLLLGALRTYSPAERSLRAGTFKPPGIAPLARSPSRCTLAILGLGGIGRRLAEMAHAIPMRVIYHSRHPAPDAPDWAEYFGPGEEKMLEMLGQADVLSVHIPLKKETVGFIGEREIRALKKGAVIVNTARGAVIDEAAMLRALKDGHLSNVGLDVYPEEPKVNPELISLPNASLLPHMGTESRDAQKDMEIRALTNLRDFLQAGSGKDLVPELR